MLLVLADGGRLAAIRATRRNGYTTLEHAAYTPCAVTTPEGCPKNPTWQINAVRVVHDPVRHRISYSGATLNLFGVPLLGLPGLSHPDGTQGGGTGFLVPEIRYSKRNGLALSAPYYLPLLAQSRPHRHAARLHQCAADARSRISAIDLARRLRPARLCDLRLAASARSSRAAGGERGKGDQGLYRGQRPPDPQPGLDHHRLRPLRDRPHLHAPLRYFARRSAALGDRRRANHRQFLHLDRRLGLRRAADHRRRRHAADRLAGDRRALADRRPDPGRPDRAPGQQPVLVSARRPGHAARLRERDLAAQRHHAFGPGAGPDRLCARRRLSCDRHPAHARRSAIAAWKAGAAASSARSRPTSNGRSSASSSAAPSA